MPFDPVEALASLGLRSAEQSLRALFSEATKARLAPVQFCEKLVALERRERDSCNLARRTRAATIGPCATLDTFDWGHPRSIDRGLCESLLQLDFVDLAYNVLLRGQSGVGKTMLAQSLALAALQKGLHVRFVSLAAALADLLRQESLPALERRLSRYTSPDLLILDEIGYLPTDSRSADLLYNIISRRHLRRATVITTNLSFKEWGAIFPGAACVGALVDRFIERCHVVDIDADSWRQKMSQQPPSTSAPPRPLRTRRGKKR